MYLDLEGIAISWLEGAPTIMLFGAPSMFVLFILGPKVCEWDLFVDCHVAVYIYIYRERDIDMRTPENYDMATPLEDQRHICV